MIQNPYLGHCWGGRWGELVAAACAGADTNRVVWYVESYVHTCMVGWWV